MRLRLCTLAVAGIAALTLISAAFAAPPTAPNPLGLTAAQTQKLKALQRKSRSEISAVGFGLGKPEEKRARILKLQEKYDAAAKAVLTPAQRSKWDAYLKAQQRKLAQVQAVQKTLTPEQKAKAQRIRRAYGLKAQKIRSDKKTTNAQKQARYATLQKQMRIELEGILTSKQRAALPR